jgi:hypothetical protein
MSVHDLKCVQFQGRFFATRERHTQVDAWAVWHAFHFEPFLPSKYVQDNMHYREYAWVELRGLAQAYPKSNSLTVYPPSPTDVAIVEEYRKVVLPVPVDTGSRPGARKTALAAWGAAVLAAKQSLYQRIRLYGVCSTQGSQKQKKTKDFVDQLLPADGGDQRLAAGHAKGKTSCTGRGKKKQGEAPGRRVPKGTPVARQDSHVEQDTIDVLSRQAEEMDLSSVTVKIEPRTDVRRGTAHACTGEDLAESTLTPNTRGKLPIQSPVKERGKSGEPDLIDMLSRQAEEMDLSSVTVKIEPGTDVHRGTAPVHTGDNLDQST